MKVYINLIYYPVKVLGPGDRVGVWFQGCTIRCKGCMSVHTWEFDERFLMDVEEVIDVVNSYPTDKLTISGGEPFDQPDALMEILKGVRKTKKDILVYTGYTFNKVKERWKDILGFIDVLIAGPFIEGEDTCIMWKGSNNQEIVVLNESLKHEYSKFIRAKKGKKLQLVESRGQFYLLGIPYQRDWKELTSTFPFNRVAGKVEVK